MHAQEAETQNSEEPNLPIDLGDVDIGDQCYYQLKWIPWGDDDGFIPVVTQVS